MKSNALKVLAAALIVAAPVAAHARSWIAYSYGSATCIAAPATPDEAATMLQSQTGETVDVNRINDDRGHLSEVDLQWTSTDPSTQGNSETLSFFTSWKACNAFAATQKSADPNSDLN